VAKKIKPIREIFDFPLKTMSAMASEAARTARTTVRKKNTFGARKYNPNYADYKSKLGRSSRNISFVDLTFSGNTLNSYRLREAKKNKATIGFTNAASEKVAADLSKRDLDFLNPTVMKAIGKVITERADKRLNFNMDAASGRTRIVI